MMRPNRRPRRAALLVTAVTALLLAAGCTTDGAGLPGDPPDGTLRVLAGSELRDILPLVEQIREATGIDLEFVHTGTLEGADLIARGVAAEDLAWFSHTKYLDLLTASTGENPVVASTPVMLSPVVLGVKQSVAERFGWVDGSGTTTGDVTWADVAARVAAGELRYGMTNPAASNSGFSALTGVAAAFAGTGSALTIEDVDTARLTEFFSGQALTAGSSGWLADAFVADQGRIDGLINYESVLLELNDSGDLDEPLALIYPRDGIITADYPLQLLDRSKRAEYDRLVEYLRSPEIQQQLMTATSRRPAVPTVEPDSRFPDRQLVELPFPGTLEVVDHLLFAYLDKFSRPTRTIFVLDVSGSMEGERLAQLKQAIRNLTGADTSLTGKFARLRARERVTIIPFNHAVAGEREFTIDSAAPGSPNLEGLRTYVDGLKAGGDTAIFSAVWHAYSLIAQEAPGEHHTSVVLMTDGENNFGMPAAQLLASIEDTRERVELVKTFAIQFGEANPEELELVTTTTGGETFDGRGSLEDAFREIRGYQ